MFNLGGNFAWNKNEIKEQLEEPRLYNNLVQTGNRLGQVYGMIAEGFFKDKEDIANSLPQNFSTVVPGDIKYKDVNGDKIIDANDRTAIGYSTIARKFIILSIWELNGKGLSGRNVPGNR